LQGVSATSDILRNAPHAKVKVFVIWEPIVFSDLVVPSNSVLRGIPDSRVAQFYDSKHLVSKALQAQMLARGVTGQDYLVKDEYVWDAVAVFPAGVRWESGTGPMPDFVGAPIVEVGERVAGYLK
jgi:hypothetical protein